MTDTADRTEAADEEEGPPPPPDGVSITIDDRQVWARKGELIIDAAERNGVYIPRFCYHPRMQPVGMCRMCIVEVDTGRGPSLQPTCMLECTPDMVVNTRSEVTKKAQDGVLEFLLVNHPLDCPVCDKGGECPLQDQTMAYGPGESRFVEEKRHFEKPIPISDLVNLDRERCILCDRCTRFAKDVAGDPLIHFIHRGNDSEVNTFPDHPFASYFSGNTVQICPVGALTASSYRFKARPWDLDQTESTCQGCAVGCRIAIQSSRDQVLRYVGVDVDPVNWGWLCDKGRFGFEAVGAENRLRDPLVRTVPRSQGSADTADQFEVFRWNDALRRVAEAINAALSTTGPAGVALIGGSRLTNEEAYAWAKLAKGVIGTDHVDCQLGDGLPAEAVLGVPRATVDEAFSPGSTVVVCGPDLKEELPVLFLRLRHAVLRDRVTVIEVSPVPTSITPLAAVSLRHRPGEANQAVRGLMPISAGYDHGAVPPEDLERARQLLADADGPVTVLLGRQSVAEQADAAVDVARAFLDHLPGVRFLSTLRRANVHGALDMGLAPGLLPGRVTVDDGRDWYEQVWPSVPDFPGLDTAGILEAAANGSVDVLILLGADPLADFPDRSLAQRGIAGARTVISIDLFLNESAQAADIVLPAAGFAECEGTTTNLEGRISLVSQKVTPPGTARSDWMIAAELAFLLGSDLQVESVWDIWNEIEQLAPSHAGLTTDVLFSLAGTDGVVAPLPAVLAAQPGAAPAPDAAGSPDEATGGDAAEAEADDTAAQLEPSGDGDTDGDTDGGNEAVDPATLRPPLVTLPALGPVAPPSIDAYSLRLVASRRLYDLGTLVTQSPSMAALAPGTALHINPYDFNRLGVPRGAEVAVRSNRGGLRLPIVVDPEVPRGAASMHVNQPGADAAELINATEHVTLVRPEVGH